MILLTTESIPYHNYYFTACLFSYLHGHKDYPIVHGNLNCDTIFIQHNGLMKIGTGELINTVILVDLIQ